MKEEPHLVDSLRYKSIVDSLSVPVFVIDHQHTVIAWNKSCEVLTGVMAADILGTKEAWRGFYSEPRPTLADIVVDNGQQGLAELYPVYGASKYSQGLHAQSWFLEINGKKRYLMFDAEPLFDEDGNLVGVVECFEDITDIKMAEEQLRLSDKVLNSVTQAIFISDANNNIVAVNQAFISLTGYSQDEVVGKSPKILSSGRHDREFYQQMWQSIITKGGWEGEVWDRRKDGTIYPKWLSINRVEDPGTKATKHYIAVFSDVTELKRSEQEARHIAFHDALTGLPNRMLFQDRLQQAMLAASREKFQVGLMFIDLDRFKQVNDGLGHKVGDALLKEIAGRISQCMRESDTVARYGGDEFVVILPEIHKTEDAAIAARRILKSFSEPIIIDGNLIDTSPSIGIAFYPSDSDDIDRLIEHADAAMYAVKSAGRGNFQFYQK